MTTVKAMDTICSYLKDNVCPKIQYLVPAEKDAGDYIPNYKNPEVFAFYEPSKSRMPPGITHTVPGIVVILKKRTDDLISGKSEFDIELSFCIWKPGEYISNKEVDLQQIVSYSEQMQIEYASKGDKKYTRTEDGWKDVYNFIDEVRQGVVHDGQMGNLKIKMDVPIQYGPYTQDKAIVDAYPYYYAWLTLTLETIVTPIGTKLDEFL